MTSNNIGKQNIEHVNINDLLDYINSNVSTSRDTFTIYHFIVGSYANNSNHECPQIVKNLLFNPEMQLSPLIINDIQNTCGKDIIIRQVLVLIDPEYKGQPLPLGLLSIIGDLPLDLTITHNLEYLNMNIKSVLEPIIVPNDINEEQIIEILKLLTEFRKYYHIIINIMDCSSNTCNNIYANSIDRSKGIDNFIHITNPECLINDSKLQYIPIMTIVDNIIKPEESLFKTKGFSIRWVNYEDDSQLIDDLNHEYETHRCPYSIIMYNSIVTLYKVKTIIYSFASLFKLWGFTTITIDYMFDEITNISSFQPIHDKQKGNQSSSQSSSQSSNQPKQLVIKFSKLSFEEFATLWKKNKNFRELDMFKYCYNNLIFNKFINYFTNKYTNKEGFSYLGLNPSIVDFIKIEAYEIFHNLSKYFIINDKYLAPSADMVSMDFIKQYLAENEISF